MAKIIMKTIVMCPHCPHYPSWTNDSCFHKKPEDKRCGRYCPHPDRPKTADTRAEDGLLEINIGCGIGFNIQKIYDGAFPDWCPLEDAPE